VSGPPASSVALEGAPTVAQAITTRARPPRDGGVRRRPTDDWPYTQRALPWMLAGFIALLWLVPIDQISMTVNLPFDLHFDRIVLPVIALPWALAWALGGPGAPRVFLSSIHGAVGVFTALAFFSVALDIGYLQQNLEVQTTIKHLVLLMSYVMLFVMLASVVRRTEVPAFLNWTLILAVMCGLGTLLEYKTHYNVFYTLSGKLLPGFKVAAFSFSYDELGRANTRGPAENALEAASMLSMALPIAIVCFIHARRNWPRVLYGLAACIVFAAGVSTYRKTALIAPLVVLLTIAFFRRRELLRFAPLMVAMILALQIASPGSLNSIINEFSGNKLTNADTTWHRSIAYEAMRPDIFSHLVFGSGYGTYDEQQNRILDSQFLRQLVEMGVLGLIAYFYMPVSVIASGVSLIRSRHPIYAPAALALAAGSAAFITSSLLSTIIAFPHVPYIFLTYAAFMAVLVHRPDGPPGRAKPLRR
jgi:hypothetical protein